MAGLTRGADDYWRERAMRSENRYAWAAALLALVSCVAVAAIFYAVLVSYSAASTCG